MSTPLKLATLAVLGLVFGFVVLRANGVDLGLKLGSSTSTLDVATIPEGALDGLVFDVSLKLKPVTPSSARRNSDCTDSQGRSAPVSKKDVEALTFLLSFAREQAGVSASLSVATVDTPSRTGSASTVPGPGDDTMGFGDLTLHHGSLRFVFQRGLISFRDSDGDGLPDELRLSDLKGTITGPGDAIEECDFSATGDGRLQTTPPSIFFGRLIRAPFLAPYVRSCDRPDCTLLADEPFIIWFSSLVHLDDIRTMVSVVDSDRSDIPIVSAHDEHFEGFSFSPKGSWPLGKTIQVMVRAGAQDRAGNKTPSPVTQTFEVVADPGPLDNFGFESGDLSGFTVTGTSPGAVGESFRGIEPAEGEQMAILGSLEGCSGAINLTARFTVPSAASHMAVDYALVTTGYQDFSAYTEATRAVISGTLRGNEGSEAFIGGRPPIEETVETSEGLIDTGFIELAVPVASLAGQEVVMTLRGRPSAKPLPFLCIPGVVLLDNIRFDVDPAPADQP